MFNDPGELKDTQNQRLSRITPELLNNLCADLEPITAARCRALVQATSAGVERGHLISFAEDGALLQELFTADGIGTQVSSQHEDLIRAARLEDVGDIVEIIRPLEEAGFLVPALAPCSNKKLTTSLLPNWTVSSSVAVQFILSQILPSWLVLPCTNTIATNTAT